MKNTKGMTLIEVIISLLIISTASLIIVVGFVTALNLFTDSNHYKDVTNKQQKALVDEENKDTDIDVNVNLSNFIPKIQINEAVKGRNIYKNYCKMMQEFSNYLKEQGVTSNDKLFEGKTKEYIKEWMMQKTGENKSDFITNLPKLYASIYPDIELDSLLEVIGTYNKNFDKEKYKYITPCMYISDSTRENLTYKDFFEDEGYKKYVFILVGDKAKKGDRPTDIWALLDNTTVEDDQDTWLIPKSKISTKILENKTYSEFYKIISGNEWIYYTTSK